MKKIIIGGIAILVAVAPLYFLVSNLQAEPVKNYNAVSPTVKVQSYRLARNGDIYEAVSASATIISSDGLLLTNSHAVLDDEDDPYDVFGICLSFNENEDPVCEYAAFLMAYDKNLDLALLNLAAVDNRGNFMSKLPYLDYGYQGEVEVGSPLDIYGYPDIGGKTLTRTRGQVGGFEDKSGVRYLKTDTDISSGNSGGTALDSEGNFIGVPTYIMSSYENIGYVLDIKKAQEFIENNLYEEPQIDEQSYSLMKVKLNLLNDTKDTNHYVHPYYPRFSLEANENWEWEDIDRTTVNLLAESNEGDKNIIIEVEHYPFKVPQSYLDETLRKLKMVNEYLTGFQQEERIFAGKKATFISYNLFAYRYYGYVILYGNSIVNIMYYVNLNRALEDLAEVNEVLDTFTFIDKPQDKPVVICDLVKSDPAFSISHFGDWYIQRNLTPYFEDLIAIYYHPDNVYGRITVSYDEIDDSKKELGNTEMLAKLLQAQEWQDGFKLINKNDSVMADNLSGWSLTYSYQGEESQEIRKVSEVYLRDGDYAYEIIYDDLLGNYNLYLNDFKNTLLSFKNYNQLDELIGQGKYDIGTLDYIFSDITYHRFEQAIADLADQGIVAGYTDGSFRPEKKITAVEAKLYIANSTQTSKRTEINENGAEFLIGMEVTLADALKALVQTYKLNLWSNQSQDAPDWKPYINKGYEMGLIPEGLVDADYTLTRGEFVYILSQLLENFELW